MKKIIRRITDYVYDPKIELKDRTFFLFSLTVLAALFVAIPAGLIMREPLSATIATGIGAVLFSLYVLYAVRKQRISRARVFISVVLVFLFLPAMFFTNGGALGGTPVWLLLGTLYIALILDGKIKKVMLLCEIVVMIACWLVGYYFPDLVTEYSRGGNYFDSIAGFFIVSEIVYTLISFQNNLFHREEAHKNMQRLFLQTATALVNAIDKKDEYTHGHSARVAEYSRKIAEYAGKTPTECDEIYYAALLHDVGKIGIDESIINKDGKLTDEEYEIIKQHPAMGAQILQSITEYPFISIGAHFHHERYDGKGYPLGLKGEDIPEIARIIAVADAYDAMTSKRSYRNSIPQEKVREEFIEGVGSQFDPIFANIMIHLIDLDTEYEMKERKDVSEFSGRDELVCETHRDEVSEGILLQQTLTTIGIRVTDLPKAAGRKAMPSLILFDSLDGRYHEDERERKNLLYSEYCEIRFDGQVTIGDIRKIQPKWTDVHRPELMPGRYRIEGVKVRDHLLIRIMDRERTLETIVALKDVSRYAYIGLTGERCSISELQIEKSEEKVAADYIPRIAEEISYINVPAGDVPNVQVDGYRSASTAGIPVRDGLRISFHTKALPTARLVWHCPSYVVFFSENGLVDGADYQEYALVRIDGETWKSEDVSDNEIWVDRQDFCGWDAWKAFNKEGYDCTISFRRDGNKIISQTENFGIAIRCTTEVRYEAPEIYVALSGDQCALTNIRITQEG